MKGERILYPCYFNGSIERKEGRRVAKTRAHPNPTLADLERAAKKTGLRYRIEQKHHPAHWWKREGRIVVEWSESKETLLKKVAAHLVTVK
jgi:signal recognition particle subunit SRP19